jgi:hypothetical protein
MTGCESFAGMGAPVAQFADMCQPEHFDGMPQWKLASPDCMPGPHGGMFVTIRTRVAAGTCRRDAAMEGSKFRLRSWSARGPRVTTNTRVAAGTFRRDAAMEGCKLRQQVGPGREWECYRRSVRNSIVEPST